MLRIFLFLATNLAVLAMAGVTMAVLTALGVIPPDAPYITLLIWCALFGFGGSLISLAMSKTIAKRSTRAKVIETPSNEVEQWLVRTVERQAKGAGIGMPEVAVFDSPDPNAFATGMFRNSALVAVSTGLLRLMSKEEAEAVLGHEVSHVANGDMVTLTLIQGVVNTFVIFLSRIVGHVVDRVVFRTESGYGPGYFIAVILAQIVLGILASMIVMWVSRKREFAADAGSAQLNGREPMIRALARLESGHTTELPESLEAFGISGGTQRSMKNLFLSHPPIPQRIEALRRLQAA